MIFAKVRRPVLLQGASSSAAADQDDKMPAWLLWMLLLCLTDEGLTRCSVHPVTAPALSKVPCPSIRAEKFSYLLLLNDSYVGKIHLTQNQQPGSEENLLSGHFEVAASSGVYVCRSERIYPPPSTEDCRATDVGVGTTEVRKEVNGSATSARHSCPDRFVPAVVMCAACGLLLVYSVSVSCIAAVLWRKRREEDCAVYMNTRRLDPKK